MKKTLLILFICSLFTGFFFADEKTETGYLTFSSEAPFNFKVGSKGWDGILEYSTDLENWNEWDGTKITSGTDNKLYLRGKNNTRLYSIHLDSYTNIFCYGNIMTLLDYEKVQNNEEPKMKEYCFAELFSGWKALTTAPDLPAKTLTDSCYKSMFKGCSSLITAPDLPATTLTPFCYSEMFEDCRSLTTVPDLPATNLIPDCYYSMFSGCTSLTTAPDLPATILPDSCYSNMFECCTSLKTIPHISAIYVGSESCMYMFYDCSNIQVYTTKSNRDGQEYYSWIVPNSFKSDCYYHMFYGTGGDSTGTPTPGTTYYILRP